MIDATDIFSENYQPSKILPALELKRQENGRYRVGDFEVTTPNMDTLRNEMQRIAIILTQTCMTRGELKQLSDLCKIEATGEKGKKGIPVYELKQNPAADAWYGNLLPEKFWKSKQLHFDRILSILRNPEGGKVDQEEAARQLERLFEEALEKEVMKK